MIYVLTDNDLNNASAALRVRGPDANSFLQGQFTQDLKLAEKGPAYGLWLDQKGKVLADSYVIRLGANDYLVLSFSTAVAAIQARLGPTSSPMRLS
jgi:folate-binding Fe-S cluster repair protein YgfZ